MRKLERSPNGVFSYKTLMILYKKIPFVEEVKCLLRKLVKTRHLHYGEILFLNYIFYTWMCVK